MSAEGSYDDGALATGESATATAELPSTVGLPGAAGLPDEAGLPDAGEPAGGAPGSAGGGGLPRSGTSPADGVRSSTGRYSWLHRWGPPGLSILTYSILGALVYGLHPPATSVTLPPCACGDISSQVWFLAWPAYALSHGLNPLYTGWADYPHGVSLMNNTAAPLLGIVFAPFTLAFGALSSFSLLMRLSFALSGISMCFVLRRWTAWWPAAFLGGLLYEFSPFMVGQSQSHLFLIFAPLPPLAVALLDEIVVRRRHLLRNGILLGVVVAAQLMISPEILAMGLLAAGCALIVMALRHPVAARERLGQLLRSFAAAGLTFVVLAGYPLWDYFRGPYHVAGPPHPVYELSAYHSYPGSLIYPTTLQRFRLGSWLAKGMALLQGNGVEHTTYVGIPLLALLAFILIRCRRVGQVQLFALVALGAWVITLGQGTRTIKLPYALIEKLPVINGALDLRYSFLMYLGIVVVLAVGLDRMRREGILGGTGGHRVAITPAARGGPPRVRPGRRRRDLTRGIACLGIGAVALLPLLPALPYQSTTAVVPALFTAADSPLRTGSVVLSYPLPISYEGPNDQALLWQSAAGMRFKLIAFRGAVAGANHQPIRGPALLLPPFEAENVLLWGLYGEPSPPPPNDAATAAAIRTFLTTYDVGAVTVVPWGSRTGTVIAYYEAALRTPPTSFEGSYIWPDVQLDLQRLRG